MKFLFVHAWKGFSLAEWSLRETLRSNCAFPVSFRGLVVLPGDLEGHQVFFNTIAAWRPDVIGFSCHFWSLADYLETVVGAKHLCPGLTVILGGPHINSLKASEDVLSTHLGVDDV